MQNLTNHLDRSCSILVRLQRSGRANPNVIGLLLVETFFRSPLYRLAEIAAWPVLWFLWPRRVATLSLGPGQIQLRHWREALAWGSLAPTWSRVRSILSWEDNYDLVHSLTAGATTTQRRAALYRGEARSFHVACVAHAVSWIRRTQSRRLSPFVQAQSECRTAKRRTHWSAEAPIDTVRWTS